MFISFQIPTYLSKSKGGDGHNHVKSFPSSFFEIYDLGLFIIFFSRNCVGFGEIFKFLNLMPLGFSVVPSFEYVILDTEVVFCFYIFFIMINSWLMLHVKLPRVDLCCKPLTLMWVLRFL